MAVSVSDGIPRLKARPASVLLLTLVGSYAVAYYNSCAGACCGWWWVVVVRVSVFIGFNLFLRLPAGKGDETRVRSRVSYNCLR